MIETDWGSGKGCGAGLGMEWRDARFGIEIGRLGRGKGDKAGAVKSNEASASTPARVPATMCGVCNHKMNSAENEEYAKLPHCR